jgi:hypothetical protein
MSQEFVDQKNHKCWGCSSFIMDPYAGQFYCFYGFMLITSDEPIWETPACGEVSNNKRCKLAGTTSILYRLLSIHKRILVSSLPKELLGCMGNLLRYNIARMADSIEVTVMSTNKIKHTNERVLEYNDREDAE